MVFASVFAGYYRVNVECQVRRSLPDSFKLSHGFEGFLEVAWDCPNSVMGLTEPIYRDIHFKSDLRALFENGINRLKGLFCGKPVGWDPNVANVVVCVEEVYDLR